MRKALFVCLSPLALAACHDSLEVPGPRPFGIVQLITSSGPSPTPTQISGVFYRGTSASIPDSRTANDACADTFFTPPTNNPVPNTLGAGDALSLLLGTSTVTIPRITGSSGVAYGVTAGTVSFTPGVQATLTIPGETDGFPASQIDVKTAEDFTTTPVPIVGGPDGVVVNWTPPGGAESAMLVSLRYGPQGSSSITRQVFCVFRDDGSNEVDPDALGGWTQGDVTTRQIVFTRFRTKTSLLTAGHSVLYIASSHVVNGQAAPAP
jgi:hypothetical protein